LIVAQFLAKGARTSLISVYRPAEMIRVWAAVRENDFGRELLPI